MRDASPPVVADPLAAILCIGVVIVTIDPMLDADGNRTGWKSTGLENDSVATAGVHFELAPHARRRHHHQ